jgi:glutamate-5-semialdehyde dehydrogenase
MAAAHDVNTSGLETADLVDYCRELATQANRAAAEVARAHGAQKNAWLIQSADSLERRTDEIIVANDRDMEAAAISSPSAAHLDRLRLTRERLGAVAEGLRQVAALPDPVGKVLDGGIRPNGLRVTKVSVPLGVIFFIYESRPNVTADAAAIAIKSGNAIVLRGGTEALHSNVILHRILQENLVSCGLPAEAVQYVSNPDRAAVGKFLRMPDLIDLAIPRGGAALIRRVSEEAQMPVLKHDMGNCHIYVDRDADLNMASRILLNAKCQRPGVCNAAESLLVHAEVASEFLPRAGKRLGERQVEVRGCNRTRELIPGALPATEADYRAEYLDLVLSVKVVENLDEAISHINRLGSHHTDCIVTSDLDAARRFTEAVDSSAVLVNASTRFNDGYELGLGAEIGISTGKFHARGPCGLLELTSYKYVIHGDGHIR